MNFFFFKSEKAKRVHIISIEYKIYQNKITRLIGTRTKLPKILTHLYIIIIIIHTYFHHYNKLFGYGKRKEIELMKIVEKALFNNFIKVKEKFYGKIT